MKALAVAVLLLLAVATPADAGQGWYLLRPPMDPRFPFGIYVQAPLSNWVRVEESYDTARACGLERTRAIEDAKRWMRFLEGEPTGRDDLYRWAALYRVGVLSQCISSDDPRLSDRMPTTRPPKAAAVPPPPPAPSSEKKPQNPYLNHLNQEKASLPKPVGLIPYTPGRPIIAVVKLNGGRSTARLILDTGADSSMVKPELLAAAGVDLSRPAARGEASGITGKVQLSYFTVDFEVAGHRARVTHVAAFSRYVGHFADGLLGRDFLDRFKVVMDPADGIVMLAPR
jgi:Aspartyl protease